MHHIVAEYLFLVCVCVCVKIGVSDGSSQYLCVCVYIKTSDYFIPPLNNECWPQQGTVFWY